MKYVMVRYKVKADRAAENERYVRAVFTELERERPEGLHYATFQLADGVSFVHLAAIDRADGSNPLTALAAFGEFTARIRERCEEPPVSAELDRVGAYQMFGP
jgi:hypothetical protein